MHCKVSPPRNIRSWFANLQPPHSVIFPQWITSAIPWQINTEVVRIQKSLYAFALGMVKQRRDLFTASKDEPEMNDILSLLVKSNDFTDDELANQVLTMQAAGHETTSSALSWCMYLLSLHPSIQSDLRSEIRANLPSPEDNSKTITASELDALPLLNAVCNEVTRLYPTVPVTIREVVRSTPLGGRVLPVGTNVLIAPWAINRSVHFWGDDAGEFKPQRWINADGTVNKSGGCESNYSLLTFLHGPRSCIGQGFARSELKCLLAAVVGRYEFDQARGAETYVPAGLVTTKPQSGMWLKMRAVGGL